MLRAQHCKCPRAEYTRQLVQQSHRDIRPITLPPTIGSKLLLTLRAKSFRIWALSHCRLLQRYNIVERPALAVDQRTCIEGPQSGPYINIGKWMPIRDRVSQCYSIIYIWDQTSWAWNTNKIILFWRKVNAINNHNWMVLFMLYSENNTKLKKLVQSELNVYLYNFLLIIVIIVLSF